MKYNLNLTRDYVSHWGLREAIRELIANNIDEGGELKWSELDFGPNGTYEVNSELRLTTPKQLPLEAFLMGYSVKTTNDAIGQYGEGLKLAVLVLTRLEMHFTIITGEHLYRFFFEQPEGFGVSTLHVERVELNPEFLPVEGTVITVYDVPKELIDELYIDARPDSVLVDQKGLYCHGLMVESDFYVRVKNVYCGINLGSSIKGNRDRNFFADKELVVPILEKFFAPKDFIDMGTSWWMSSIFQNLSQPFKQRVARAWLTSRLSSFDEETIGDNIVLIPDYSGNRHSKKEGYIIAPIWFMGGHLMTKEQRDILMSLRIDDDDVTIEDDSEDRKQQLALKILTDCNLAHTKQDIIVSLINYINGLGDLRNDVEEQVLQIYEQKVTPKKRVKK